MQPESTPLPSAHVLFIADTGAAVGFGHVRRCYALGAEMRSAGVRSVFLLRGDGVGYDWLRSRGESARVIGCDEDVTVVVRTVARCRAQVVVLDTADPIGERYVRTLRKTGSAVAMLGCGGPGSLAADLSVSPAAPPRWHRDGHLGERVASPAYAILGERFRPRPTRVHDARRVLVVMGAADPDGMILTAIAALDRVEEPVHPVAVIGPAFELHARLHEALAGVRQRFEVHYNVPALAPLVATADVGIAATGMTAYELAAAGVPSVLVPRSPADRWQADFFALAGAAVVSERDPESIAVELRPLVADAGLRRKISHAAERLVDGRGTERVAELIRRFIRGGRELRRGRLGQSVGRKHIEAAARGGR